MNVIYLRYKGRETGFPPAETTFELVHCLLPSPPPPPPSCLSKKREGGRERRIGDTRVRSEPRGWLLREVRRSGESKKYYIINTDPRVQWGRLGVCVKRARHPPAFPLRGLPLSIFQLPGWNYPPLAPRESVSTLSTRLRSTLSLTHPLRSHRRRPPRASQPSSGTSGIYILII